MSNDNQQQPTQPVQSTPNPRPEPPTNRIVKGDEGAPMSRPEGSSQTITTKEQ